MSRYCIKKIEMGCSCCKLKRDLRNEKNESLRPLAKNPDTNDDSIEDNLQKSAQKTAVRRNSKGIEMTKVESKKPDKEEASMKEYAAGNSLTNAFTENLEQFQTKNFEEKVDEPPTLDTDIKIKAVDKHEADLLGETQDRIDTQADVEEKVVQNVDVQIPENKPEIEESTLISETKVVAEVKNFNADVESYFDLDDMSKPINLQHLNADDLSSKEKIENLVPIYGMLAMKYYDYMLNTEDKFSPVLTQDGPSKIDLSIKSVKNEDGNIIHVAKQSFYLNCPAEVFLWVSNDPETQLKISSTFSSYQKLAEHLFEDDLLIQFYRSKSKGVQPFLSPRDSIFVKFVKKIREGEYLSLNKTILINEGEVDPLEKKGQILTNINLSGYLYKEEKTEEGKIVTRGESYNCTDLKFKTALMIAKPLIIKNTRDFIKSNMAEIDRLAEEGKSAGTLKLF